LAVRAETISLPFCEFADLAVRFVGWEAWVTDGVGTVVEEGVVVSGVADVIAWRATRGVGLVGAERIGAGVRGGLGAASAWLWAARATEGPKSDANKSTQSPRATLGRCFGRAGPR
jgi:hypothetical protein